jgi:hypothetical protein
MSNIARKCVLAAAVALSGQAAQAATVTAVYTGTVGLGLAESTFDNFGPILDGVGFTLTFIYDTAVGFESSSSFEQVSGGTEAPVAGATPISYAILNFEGTEEDLSISTAGYGQATVFDDGNESYVYHFGGSLGPFEAYVEISEFQPVGTLLTDLSRSSSLRVAALQARSWTQMAISIPF